jgi:hypothetical protein
MSTAVIEMNDAGLRVWRDDELVLESPGFALLGEQIEAVGEAAWAQARLHPRAVNDRFWDELGLEPLSNAAGGVLRTAADLACEHFAQVWSAASAAGAPDEAFLAVPGDYSRDQLGLVLGIAGECDLPVAGMMDTALAALARVEPGSALLHLDVHLHRAVVTRFTQGEQLVRAGVERARGAGLADLRERWLSTAAQQFIDATRFDPLHDARSEQALYDALEARRGELAAGGSRRLEVVTSSRTHGIVVDSALLADAAAEIYGRIVELVRASMPAGEPVRLYLSARAAGLPGLAARLAELPDVDTEALAVDAVARGLLASADALRGERGDGVPYLTQLAWLGPAAVVQAPVVAAPSAQVPTHLLYEGIARPLGRTPLTIGSQPGEREPALVLGAPLSGVSRRHCSVALREDGQVLLTDSSSHGTFVNGRAVAGETLLRLGDRVRVGTPGHELQLIRVAG